MSERRSQTVQPRTLRGIQRFCKRLDQHAATAGRQAFSDLERLLHSSSRAA